MKRHDRRKAALIGSVIAVAVLAIIGIVFGPEAAGQAFAYFVMAILAFGIYQGFVDPYA